MAYIKTDWNDKASPGISAEKMDKIEQGIYEAHENIALIAGQQMPEEYLKAAVDDYINENQAGLAKKEDVEEATNQLSSEIVELRENELDYYFEKISKNETGGSKSLDNNTNALFAPSVRFSSGKITSGKLKKIMFKATSDGEITILLGKVYQGAYDEYAKITHKLNVSAKQGINTLISGVDYDEMELDGEYIIGAEMSNCYLYYGDNTDTSLQYASNSINLDEVVFITGSTTRNYGIAIQAEVEKLLLENRLTALERKKYQNKILSTFGDSITQGATWQQIVLEKCGFELFNNYGVGSTCITSVGESDTSAMVSDARINAISDTTDFLTVMGGINDWAQNKPIGDISYYNTDETTFFGACNVMLRKLQTKFPKIPILALGCHLAKIEDRSNFTDKRGILNNHNLSSRDYAYYFMKSAEMNGVEHYDMGGHLGVGEYNIADYFADSETMFVHPIQLGGETMGEKIANYINTSV